MSVNEKLTAIADKIREYAQVDHKFSLGMMPDGIDMVYETGHVAGMDDRDAELADENAELASALTSGGTNDETIDVNASRAAKDLVMVKNYIKNSLGVDVPEGTLSSVYPNFLLSGAIALINEAEQEIYDTIINPAKDKLSQRMQGKTGTETALGIYVDAAIGDFDAIESALESQGFDVPDNNTSAIAEVIGNACEERYTLGHADGYSEGYTEGETAGIEEGKKSQYDEFWDNFQNKGSRRDYGYAFGLGWNNNNFKPKYNMQPTTLVAAFDGMQCTDCDFRELGIDINYGECSSFQSAFRNFTGLTAIVINYTGYAANFGDCFYGCTGLSYLKLAVHAGLNFYNNAFYNCTALTDLIITGTIGKLINLKWSPLNKASITSVVNHLSASTGETATFNKTAKEAAFTDEEWAALIADKSNWTISLV